MACGDDLRLCEARGEDNGRTTYSCTLMMFFKIVVLVIEVFEGVRFGKQQIQGFEHSWYGDVRSDLGLPSW